MPAAPDPLWTARTDSFGVEGNKYARDAADEDDVAREAEDEVNDDIVLRSANDGSDPATLDFGAGFHPTDPSCHIVDGQVGDEDRAPSESEGSRTLAANELVDAPATSA